MAKKEKLARMTKEKMVDEIVSKITEHPNFVITTYTGSTVSDLEALRRDLKGCRSGYFVVKNSILKVAFDRIKLERESKKIESGMGISLSGADIISTCKTLVAFSKTHDKFKIKGAIIDGKSVDVDKVKVLAELPTKNVLLARVVGGIKAPISGFVNALSGVLRKFVNVVDAIKETKTKGQRVADSV